MSPTSLINPPPPRNHNLLNYRNLCLDWLLILFSTFYNLTFYIRLYGWYLSFKSSINCLGKTAISAKLPYQAKTPPSPIKKKFRLFVTLGQVRLDYYWYHC